ncbi:hypothetical protein E2C01_088967 [Portunus trituberculatus]|uniref:Secreted protein n=1 Tax=Portunus trituberculatus TaxID=210409 RepID=A0A5B7JC99_PORTR|nr:hypothetical protein [Portunus trituberculatus]
MVVVVAAVVMAAARVGTGENRPALPWDPHSSPPPPQQWLENFAGRLSSSHLSPPFVSSPNPPLVHHTHGRLLFLNSPSSHRSQHIPGKRFKQMRELRG